MPELWTPGAEGPLDQLVERIHRRVQAFAAEHGLSKAFVEIDLMDGSTIEVASLSPEPGYGLLTVCPHGDEPEELIVPLGMVRRITIGRAEERSRLGFSLPEA